MQPSAGAVGPTQQNRALAARGDSSNYKVLYRFLGEPDGAFPFASLVDVRGTLYGTTELGGTSRRGTVFSVTAGGTEKTLYSFKNNPDGGHPLASLIDVEGMLYGTTAVGGTARRGTVFSTTTSGTEKTLYSFENNPDGGRPVASLIDVKGTLYGTTEYGGAYSNLGTVFSVTMSGKENVLHSFGNGTDGQLPLAGLLSYSNTLYGTTAHGGSDNTEGTLFSITTSGTEKVLHSFCTYCDYQVPDGIYPAASLIVVGTTLYGTGYSGGEYYTGGAVFAFDPTVSRGGLYGEKAIYSFGHGSDGAHPTASLLNVNSTLYGTTEKGGTYGKGTVFSVSTFGAEKVLHSFGNGSDGARPEASLIDVDGTLYGTTEEGGMRTSRCPKGCGTVFSLGTSEGT